MIVDDSVVVRGLVSRWLTEDGGFEVVGTAANGRAAIDLIERAAPDLVLLDLEMPEVDGFTALPKLLERRPGVSVVVISTLTHRNADVSLKCLSLGATDYLAKPDSHRGVTTSTTFRAELLAKLHALGGARRRRFAPAAPAVPSRGRLDAPAPAAPAAPALRTLPRPRAGLVAPRALLVGASTGGPRAVAQVLGGLGASLQRVPILVVQHMPPIFTAVFAEHLATHTGMIAREPEHGERLTAGRIYVAPGGRHMGLAKDGTAVSIRLDDSPPVNFCRPAVDVLFRDAAAVFGASALAVVLTGMGSDGTNGARALVETGATMIAQDEATSTVWGMPGSIAKAGLAHEILPLDGIAPALKTLLSGAHP
ncbi:chemotaxis response regulator protein-glutamate methylesterase [Salinarimonas soli]|uniref:Protein-glutamate methylesterase/protein-glutamine glutaminase n=1 Tax=Salinarimonas soli TaxID=1638099 RepID=A0A5B2VB23_9HYPH|nr:chemotaxis response regulator protein-glutamate methylesterase [Salinarimonas soli]KAA2235815.1 chemotaxis response regulator protein-glutamate methylesterase [Salinarimonas soli]